MASFLFLLSTLVMISTLSCISCGRTMKFYTPDETGHFGQQPRNSPEQQSEENNDTFDCELRASNKSKGHFRHIVYFADLNFVYLHINTSLNVTLKSKTHVIGPAVWTWTFSGSEGALEFLSWPLEFGIWSMGLLNSFVGRFPVDLEADKGNCSDVTVGDPRSNTAISKALIQLVQKLMELGFQSQEKYGPSFFCYKERLLINPSSLYTLCKHIVCPYEAVQYQCCSYFYKQKLQNRTIDCDATFSFRYDSLWWVGPILVSLMIFAYLPLLLMNISSRVVISQDRSTEPTHRETYLDMDQSDFVFYDGHFHITLFNTIFSPVLHITRKFQSTFYRVIRFLLPWLSLSLIGLQILLDSKYLSGFVLDSVKSEAPMGFRSMLAGYYASTRNFLPYLGGPYVALGIYIAVTCFFIVLPGSLSEHLESGIPDKISETDKSPLMLSLMHKEQLGCVSFHMASGYKKIYNFSLSQFYMLLNKEYWSYAIKIQVKRWGSQNSKSVACLCLFPVYVLFCVAEHILCVLFYGLPIASFALIITRSYYRCIIRIKHERLFGKISPLVVVLLMILLVTGVAFFLFMFCTIFLDACLFCTRIFIFTYTGIVVYPKVSYGYLIFTLTAIYYLWDCVTDYSLTYNTLLKVTIKVSQKLQRANDRHPNVIKVGIFRGVRESIFEHVIERICPRRKRAFLSLLKLCIILGVIGLSLELLLKTDSFRELHILVHVTTALFTCAVPRIAQLMFGKVESRLEQMIFEDNVNRVVCEMFSDSDSHILEDYESESE